MTPAFDADVRLLSASERRKFRAAIHETFVPAAERHVDEPGAPWLGALRVKRVRGAQGIWELTWSFAGPDGRATFEWVEIEGLPAIRWRRVGRHAILAAP